MSYIFIASHAQARLRQRFGIESLSEMRSWARIKKQDGEYVRTEGGGQRVYQCDDTELFFSADEKTLITVVDLTITKNIIAQLGDSVMKEARKLLTVKERAFRKAEINVAEITLNMLKARNPKIKAKLNDILTIATDEKENLLTEIKAIKYAAKEYGVEV